MGGKIKHEHRVQRPWIVSAVRSWVTVDYTWPRKPVNDITILDLFWLILKFIAAQRLVGLVALALYVVWKAAKRAAKTTWDTNGHTSQSNSLSLRACAISSPLSLSPSVLSVRLRSYRPRGRRVRLEQK
jgi:hypothetical protein